MTIPTMKQIAQILLFARNNRLIIYLRDDKPKYPFPNHWDLIGGHLLLATLISAWNHKWGFQRGASIPFGLFYLGRGQYPAREVASFIVLPRISRSLRANV